MDIFITAIAAIIVAIIAALIAINQHVSRPLVWQAFIGGLLHDVGMLIFLTQQPEVFMAVVELAQCQGQELGVVEKNFLGTTHAECGARFLSQEYFGLCSKRC